MAGGILAAGALFAAPVNDVKITVPHTVTVGAATLPVGTYTLSPMETSDGTEFFVVRGGNIAPVVLQVQKVDGDAAAKTAVTFSEDGDTWRFGKLSVEGETTSYEFAK
jgi:hypothetical protein